MVITGIVPVVHALVMRKANVEMAPVMSMKTVKPVKKTVVYVANEMLVI